jgi:hypothetical protein
MQIGKSPEGHWAIIFDGEDEVGTLVAILLFMYSMNGDEGLLQLIQKMEAEFNDSAEDPWLMPGSDRIQ